MAKTSIKSFLEAAGGAMEVVQISLSDIACVAQVRLEMEDEENSLQTLAESIKAQGILMPLHVRREGEGYVVVAGERRLRAAQSLDLETVPCVIYDGTEEGARDIQFGENKHRKALTASEIAAFLKDQLERLGSADDVAKKWGMSQSSVSKYLSLTNLTAPAEELSLITSDVEVIASMNSLAKKDEPAALAALAEMTKTPGAPKREILARHKPKKTPSDASNPKSKKAMAKIVEDIMNDDGLFFQMPWTKLEDEELRAVLRGDFTSDSGVAALRIFYERAVELGEDWFGELTILYGGTEMNYPKRHAQLHAIGAFLLGVSGREFSIDAVVDLVSQAV